MKSLDCKTSQRGGENIDTKKLARGGKNSDVEKLGKGYCRNYNKYTVIHHKNLDICQVAQYYF